MSFITRWAESWVESLETGNPEAVYESALAQQKEAIARSKDVLTSAMVRRNQRITALETSEQALRGVMEQLRSAVDSDDDEVALALIQEKDDLVATLERLTAALGEARDDVATAKQSLEQAKANLQTLTKEKSTAIAELRVAQAKLDIENANSAFSDDPTARGLTTVRESIDRLEARAHKGYLDSEGRSIRGKVEAYEKRTAEERARAELSRLKSAAGTPEDEAVDDQADVDPRTKRSL